MEAIRLNYDLDQKVRNKQKYICTNLDLSKVGYVRDGKRGSTQAWKYSNSVRKTLEEKIHDNQRHITSEKNLSEYGYIVCGFRKDKLKWRKNIPKECHQIPFEEKIRRKQRFIKTNFNLEGYGYTRDGQNKGVQIWIHKEYSKENSRLKYIKYRDYIIKYRKEYQNSERGKNYSHNYYFKHKEKYAMQRKRWYALNKEKSLEYVRKYRNTEHGKLKSRENYYNHIKRGFIPLFRLSDDNIDIEWHHIDPELPFVIPIPRGIHQRTKGKNHYIGVVQEFYSWLKCSPNIHILPFYIKEEDSD